MSTMIESQSHVSRPKVQPGAHPIETARYLLCTPVIDAFFAAVCQWITNRVPGGMIYGKPRLGKTRAIQFLVRMLLEKFGSTVPIISFSCRDYPRPNEGVFFGDLLRAAGHTLWSGGKPDAKRQRLNEFLLEIVERSLQNRLILFIDEAQKLLELHYKWLIDLHNELDSHNIGLIVILVGQEELGHQLSAFQVGEKTQIVGRFMVHQFHFRGLKSAKDIRYCLGNYDEVGEYPENSGCSFTRYYFPNAFDAGFRLESSSKELWQAFREVREEGNLPLAAEIPMQFFCRTVEYVLTTFGTLEDTVAGVTLNQWKKAIRCSGYAEAESYVVAPDANN